MTDTPARPLSAWEWVSLSSTDIRRLGHNPQDRVHYTGHKANLPRSYLPSIGHWGALNTEDFVNTQQPHLGMINVAFSAFRQFRYSRGLMTCNEFERHHGSIDERPWIFAELSWCQHARVQLEFGDANKGAYCSVGTAAAQVVLQGMDVNAPRSWRLGLLPIEVVLWARLFDLLLMNYGVGHDDWAGFDEATKAQWWGTGILNKTGSTRLPFELDLVAKKPAERELPSFRPPEPERAAG